MSHSARCSHADCDDWKFEAATDQIATEAYAKHFKAHHAAHLIFYRDTNLYDLPGGTEVPLEPPAANP